MGKWRTAYLDVNAQLLDYQQRPFSGASGSGDASSSGGAAVALLPPPPPLPPPTQQVALVRHFSAAVTTELLAELAVWKRLGKGMCLADIAPFACVGWLATLRQSGACPLLLEFLTLLVQALRRSQDADSAANALAITSMLAILLDAGYPQWQSPLGWQAALQLKALTGSALAVDILSKAMPGAPCSRTLAAMQKREVAALSQEGACRLRTDTHLRFAEDGVGNRGGHHCRVACKNQQLASRSSAVTSLKADHLFVVPAAGEEAKPNLQKFTEYAPATYNMPERRRAQLPLDFATVSANDKAPVMNEKTLVLASALKRVPDRCIQQFGVRRSRRQGDVVVHFDGTGP